MTIADTLVKNNIGILGIRLNTACSHPVGGERGGRPDIHRWTPGRRHPGEAFTRLMNVGGFDVIGDEEARFENLVASSLLKRFDFLEDRTENRFELRFVRDKEGREVDFAIVREGRLVELIEAKYSDDGLARPLRYFAKRLNPIRATQIVARLKHPLYQGKFRMINPLSYFGSFFPPQVPLIASDFQPGTASQEGWE